MELEIFKIEKGEYMKLVKALLMLPMFLISFNAGAVQEMDGTVFPNENQTVELLTNEITIEDGRTFSNRLRICNTVTSCQVYMITDDEILEKVQVLLDRREEQVEGRNDSFDYVRDPNVRYIKFITDVRFGDEEVE